MATFTLLLTVSALFGVAKTRPSISNNPESAINSLGNSVTVNSNSKCRTVSYYYKTLDYHSDIYTPAGHPCQSLLPNYPTTVTLNISGINPDCSYQLVAFHGPNCLQGDNVTQSLLNLTSSTVKLNDRKEIASLRLAKQVTGGDSVNVTFHGHSKSIILNNTGCYDLVSGNNGDSFYPDWLEIKNRNGTVVDLSVNHVTLYTQVGCRNGSELKHGDGTIVSATHDTNLLVLTTLFNSTLKAGSFVITNY